MNEWNKWLLCVGDAVVRNSPHEINERMNEQSSFALDLFLSHDILIFACNKSVFKICLECVHSCTQCAVCSHIPLRTQMCKLQWHLSFFVCVHIINFHFGNSWLFQNSWNAIHLCAHTQALSIRMNGSIINTSFCSLSNLPAVVVY